MSHASPRSEKLVHRLGSVMAAVLILAAGVTLSRGEFVGATTPASFSVCDSAVDDANRPRPECQGSDIKFRYDAPNPAGSQYGFSAAAGHLNEDDRVDLVVGDPGRNRVYVFFGRQSAQAPYDLDPNDLSDRLVSAESQADVILTREPNFPGQVKSFGFSVAVSSERVAAASCDPNARVSALLVGAPGRPGTTGNDPGTVFHVPAGAFCLPVSNPPVPMVSDPIDLGGQSLQAPDALADDEFGYSVAFGRVLTNSGTDPDVIVGARRAGAGAGGVTFFPVSNGVVELSRSGLVLIEGLPGDGVGEVLSIGDLDEDHDPNTLPRGNLDDLAIGAAGHDKGKVLLIQGPISPTDGRDGDGILREGVDSQVRSATGEKSGDLFGFSVAISAQGDLAVGAVFADNTPPDDQQPGGGDPLTNVASGVRYNAGKVYVWNAPVVGTVGTDTPANTADVVYVARRSGDQLGFSIAYGDFDGSGKDDLALAARREDGSGLRIDEIDHGTVYVVYDTTTVTSPVDLNVCDIASECTGVSGVDVMLFGGDREAALGEEIGFAMAAGNFNGGDASDDLFVSSVNHRTVYAVTFEDTDADRSTNGRNIRDGDDDNDGEPDATDCAPATAAIKPGATEITCNAIDENCSGMGDDSPDADADGYDTCNDGAPGDHDDKAADCADADPNSRPGALEVCDGNDNDCSGSVPAVELDSDNDRYAGCTPWLDTQGDNPTILGGGDCDRTDPATFPGSANKEPVPTACMRDRDGDEFGDAVPPVGVNPGTDCDDGSANGASTFPGAAPNESSPSACMKDVDGDNFGDSAVPPGVTRGTDCDDADASSRPGGTEVCDGNDNDCSGTPATGEQDTDGDHWVECLPWVDTQGNNAVILGGGDCAPADPGVFPAAAPNEATPTACMKDADGDDYGDLTPPSGVLPGTDCNDDPNTGSSTFPGAAQIEAPLNCMKDTDNDGWGDDSVSLPAVPGSDCNDAVQNTHPGAAEIVDDGSDQDCSGADTVTCFVDVDGDGFGSTTAVLAPDGFCTDPGEAPASTDCNDLSTSIHPGAAETADDGIDQDCNGADTIRCILDADQDGFGTTAGTTALAGDGQCDASQQEASSSDDCDDADATTHPGGTERCDGNDNDCSGSVPAGETDPDNDLYVACSVWTDTQSDNPTILGGGDCGPAAADIFPGASPKESVPSACTKDQDGDDYGDLTPPPGVTRGTDCDDVSTEAADTFPGAAEIEAPLNCMRDVDGDGYGDAAATLPIVRGTDCDDARTVTHPGAPELCDGNNNACSGPVSADETDPDGDRWVQCAPWSDIQGDNPSILGGADCAPTDPDAFPGSAPSEPFGAACMQDKDDDDFGDLTPPPGVTPGTDCDDDSAVAALTYPGSAEVEAPLNCMKDGDGDGWGDVLVALPVVAGTDCDDSDSTRFPTAMEIVGDGIDQDCSGADSVTCHIDGDIDGYGGSGTLIATDGDCTDSGESMFGTDCNEADPSIHPGAPETLGDGVDQDCDLIDLLACLEDLDGDGFGTMTPLPPNDPDCTDPGESQYGTDCNDAATAINPGALEICGDSIDSDCDGADPVCPPAPPQGLAGPVAPHGTGMSPSEPRGAVSIGEPSPTKKKPARAKNKPRRQRS